jgi:hypothetical protein
MRPQTKKLQSHNREHNMQLQPVHGYRSRGDARTYVAEVRHPRLPVAHHQCLQETRPKGQGTRDDARGVMTALTSCVKQGYRKKSLALLGSPLETSAVSCNGGGGGGGMGLRGARNGAHGQGTMAPCFKKSGSARGGEGGGVLCG